MKIKLKIVFILIFLLVPLFASADTLGQKVDFSIDSSYDLSNREQISAVLIGISHELYFYLDENWWQNQNFYQQNDIKNSINFLASEFENQIYPTLTYTFGSMEARN